ncbi:murein biosynthesis integral membrane protein MurJ [Effusibacillus lacus]|nr:murein biosynthesis integral membrane protein MurJ [Effusibacillus lacus]TCS73722.1 putative peptidoglycan lipid II flippase [Effusibacillus lacus]
MFLFNWEKWRQKSILRRMFDTSLVVGILTVGIKIALFIKELVIAYHFGTSDVLDAYLIAYTIPAFAVNLIAGSFNAALIPTYIQVQESENRAEVQKLFSNVVVLSFLLLVFVTLVLGISAPYILSIIGSGFTREKLALTQNIFYFLLPTIAITGVTTIWAAVLNASERFVLSSLVPILTPLVTVAIIIFFGSEWGIYTLALGTIVGSLFEVMFLGFGLKQQRLSLRPKWYGTNTATKQVITQYLPMIAGAFLMGSTGIIDQSMATMLNSGSVSVLNYGNKIVAAILSTCSTVISIVVLPYFSKMVASNNWTGIKSTLMLYAKIVIGISIPLTIILIYFSDSLVELLYERGAFTNEDTRMVANVQAMYFLQIPFYILGIVMVRLISAFKANQILMKGAIISLILNIVFNYLFMNWMGIAGIALSTSVVYLVSFIYLLSMLLKLLRRTAGNI